MELMQPIQTAKIIPKKDWIYEVKYDGFRASLLWSENNIQIISRNNIDLTENFPEVLAYCKKIEPVLTKNLPIQLDGELVVLNNAYQANFSAIQKRGRLKLKEKIAKLSIERPATFIAFDLLQQGQKDYRQTSLKERKKMLVNLFKKLKEKENMPLQMIKSYEDYEEVSTIVFYHKGEGIVAKQSSSLYVRGKAHDDWLKEKNWRKIYVFLTAYDVKNDYFQTGIYHHATTMTIGKCKHGLSAEEMTSLKKIFMSNGEKEKQMIRLPPAICASINTLDLHANELREPEFAELLPTLAPEDCTKERLELDLAMLPEKVNISNEDKIFWPKKRLTKGNLLVYIREIYPYIIPYVQNRALTVIRCPDGIEEKSFFQKNLPSYAPDYIDYLEEEDKRIQICNQLESLIWFANHSAIEYHVPFQTIDSMYPNEIVFDLDPPSREKFVLAIKAAKMIKQLLDGLELISFIKTSGNKGLQIHIPIPTNRLSFEQTAIFTETIAKIVVNAAPDLFTIERFKKNRGGRLYIDYVQHGKNKTIIAPYSPRKTEDATIATPLYWEEVTEKLDPNQFTIQNVVERVKTVGCPWIFHFEAAREQKLTKTLDLIRSN
ncbi:DNA ligase D [Pseudogracilibacillus sp. SO30301A]|uniref:DNA ligase D n=1 Tax=Pseudogracilibacillus sp. SO30301A TaxID=3098291 RepID=UPI00300E3CB0